MSGQTPAPRSLPRVRVTAPRSPAPRIPASPHGATSDVDAVFVRSLIRSQLRLALVCAAVFGGLLALLAVLIGVLPLLADRSVLGVPASWLLLAVGAYPLVLVTALIFLRASRRNEARYRSLVEHG
ncbi:heavy metal transporter [Rathayibacter sp. YIM 133350]|uniref:heavy metal transporter n=1 Tax=Rathayibacter sp. YIM 133350 TaxID=3131992 RepID=UPI00307CD2ED